MAVTPDLRKHVEEVFEAALEVPASRRASFVREAADGDERLLAAVVALLDAHDRAGVLERPLPPPPRPPLADDRIGPYRIVGELGRGGMGVVYAAERDDGHFRRRVAIKVLRSDADPSLEARVVAERQILASLDHPNIARLLDGGVTDDGRPFLVMEHVDGLPVDVYADRMRLTIEERIRLFLTVTEAVQHAHRNLVVHRDLKPSNILVASRGTVKLLDFGIAKLLNPALGPDGGSYTIAGQQALTPEYASPEQVRGEALSTSSDVYSLGVVLYRLLTGCHPYAVDARSMESIVEAVGRCTPRRPSEIPLRAEQDNGRSTPAEDAAARRTTPERLARRLRGDLDAIVLRTLRKQPGDRYGSADLLAQDLRRHLEGHPVEARRGARGYRLRSFMRRHRYPLVAAAVVMLSLMGGAGAASWQARVASAERDRAEEALGQSKEITAFLMSLFSVGDPAGVRLEEITAADLLRRGVDRAEGLDSQPLVQARMLGVIGGVHRQLGQYDDAVRLLRRSLAGRMAELGPEHPETATAMNDLGLALRFVAGYDEARRLHREALRIQQATVGARDTAIATTLGHLAYIEFDLNERAAIQRQILDIQSAALGPDDPVVGETLFGLANTERGLGHFDTAMDLLGRALASRQRALGPDHPEAALPMLHIGDILAGDLGEPDEAERLYRDALAIQERALGDHDVLLIHGLHSLGDLLGREGRHEESEALLRRSVGILSDALGADHPRTVGSYLHLGGELLRQGRDEEAEALLRRVVEVWGHTLGPRHPSVANARVALAQALQAQGRLDEAEGEVETALDIRSQALGERSLMIGLTLTQLGDIFRQKGELDRARSTYREGRQILLRHVEADHPQVVDLDLRLDAVLLEARNGPSTSGRGG
jgi:serine/threonine protein kinase/Flp pilus assembly protein TadD